MALHTKLSSALKNSNWFWKPTRLEDLHIIQSWLSLVEVKGWTRVRFPTTYGMYSCADTWEAIRAKQSEVNCGN